MTNTMTYRGYTAALSLDPDDGIIVGRVLDVDDIITFHGETVAEFEARFRTAIDGYLAACESLGAPPNPAQPGPSHSRV
jgi:predicted HicB family RNase H-like nuclease